MISTQVFLHRISAQDIYTFLYILSFINKIYIIQYIFFFQSHLKLLLLLIVVFGAVRKLECTWVLIAGEVEFVNTKPIVLFLGCYVAF